MYRRTSFQLVVLNLGIVILFGCASAGDHRKNMNKAAYNIIQQKQMEALGRLEPFTIETPEETLRKKLLLEQNLPYYSKASLGAKNLDPIDHWPDDDYLESDSEIADATELIPANIEQITLFETLQIAAKNSRPYQTQKENVFRTALQLELARDEFRNTFRSVFQSNISADLGGDETVSGIANTGDVSFSRLLQNGVSISTGIGIDLVKMLNPFDASSGSMFTDASITIPLLRGAGRHIVAEPLTQAERNTIYAIHDFERYKRDFAVDVADSYLSVLQQADEVQNSEDNYERLILAARRSKRLGDAGDLSPVEVDQAIQDELRARDRWIQSQMAYERSLDSFKMLLGLPADAKIELDKDELQRLASSAASIIKTTTDDINTSIAEESLPADAPVILRQPSKDRAGAMELEEDVAIQLAFENRLDLRTVQGEVYDAQRSVIIAADRLRPELTLLGSTSAGEGRSLGNASVGDNFDLDFEKGRYNALVTLDLPLERTSEAVNYRNSIINLERAVRNLQDLEDQVKNQIRNHLRNLLQARESLQTQALAVELAERRVKMTDLYLQAGRAQVRDLLEAQEALLSAQNSLTNALVDYRIAELRLQSDLGLLEVNEKGLWKEYNPEVLKNNG